MLVPILEELNHDLLRLIACAIAFLNVVLVERKLSTHILSLEPRQMVVSLLLLILYAFFSVSVVTSSSISARGLLFLSSMVISRGWLMPSASGGGL